MVLVLFIERIAVQADVGKKGKILREKNYLEVPDMIIYTYFT
jgi:hypothetical protein